MADRGVSENWHMPRGNTFRLSQGLAPQGPNPSKRESAEDPQGTLGWPREPFVHRAGEAALFSDVPIRSVPAHREE